MLCRNGNPSIRFRLLAIGLLLALTVVLAGCAPSAPVQAQVPTPAPATATSVPTPVPPTATSVPTPVPPTATPKPTLPPPTATSAPTATPVPDLPPVTSDVCLGCHGPYDKVVKASASYVTDKGEKVNPHTTVDEKELKAHTTGKGMVECSKCHKSHPQPLVSVKDVAKANVSWCYLNCHHQDNFTPCGSCHSKYNK